jgi:tetratricopeptide (TPR) repeat protein
MVTKHGEVKIVDFGLAKLAGRTLLTRSGTTMGTAAYMSPEQARGEQVDARTDVWSVGVVLYEMLAGKRPFESEYDQALVYSILNEEPTPIRSLRAEVPEVVEQIVAKALAKNTGDRYQNIGQFLADLKIARGTAETGGTIAAAEATEAKSKKRLIRRVIIAGGLLLVLGAGAFVLLPFLHDQAIASNPKTIAFISFENQTGDESLRYLRNVLPEVLASSLGESKYFRVLRSDRMREMMKQMRRDTAEFISRETGMVLCRRAGTSVMAVGNYTKAGPVFLAALELIDVNTGDRIGSPMKARGREVESFLKEDGIVDDLAQQILQGIGVSRIGAQVALKAVAEVSSSSLEAQRYFQRGKRELDKFNLLDARRFLELAVKEDSTFAIAWFWLGAASEFLGDRPAQASATRQAVKNASRATERQKFVIAGADPNLRAFLLRSEGRPETGSDWMSWLKARSEIFPSDAEFRREYGVGLRRRGKVTQAIAEYEKVLQLDPSFLLAYNELAYNYVSDGQGEKGMQILERYAELEPGEYNPLHSAAECLLMLGRFDEGIAKCEAALRIKQGAPDSWYAVLTRARLDFMKEDYSNAVRWTARAFEMAPGPAQRTTCLWWHAWYLVWSGRLREADETLRELEQKFADEYRMKHISEIQRIKIFGAIHWLSAFCAYEKGDLKQVRLDLSKLPALGDWPWSSQFCLGLADLQQGKTDSLDTRLQRINDTLLAFTRRETASSEQNEELARCFRNALQGAYLLATHRPTEIHPNWTRRRSWVGQDPDSLTAASWPLYLPWGGEPTTLEWIPIPFDILPRAYAEQGMIDSAIVSYELAVRKPPHFLGPIIPRYYYRLARLYEQKGVKDKAIGYYATFLKVWGKADPVYKEPADARARLARLRKSI